MNDLATKYRPSSFQDVIGQDAVIQSLQSQIERDQALPPCLLLCGDPGLGKTTIARICAKQVGCSDSDIIEINGAEKTSVEDMRDIIELMSLIPIRGSKRVVIIDEAHRLSRQAWDSILKPTEEPPPGSTWIFCSTNPSKIPEAIWTRFTPPSGYRLRKVEVAKIRDMLTKVAETEALTVAKSVLNLVAIKANGSPRRALKLLSAMRGVESLAKASALINDMERSEESSTLALCRLLKDHGPWHEAVALIRKIEDDNETVRIIITNYFSKVVMDAKNMDALKYALQVLYTFSTPFNPSDKLAPILLGAAQILLD